MATYPYGMKDLPRVTALPRVPLPRATPINNRKSSILKSITFLSNDTWVAPAGVKQVEKAVGKGSNGSSGSYNSTTLNIRRAVALATTNPTGGLLDVDTIYSVAASDDVANFSGTGARSVSYENAVYSVGTDDLSTSTSTHTTVNVNGAAVSEYGSSGGNLTNARAADIYVRITVDVMSGGSSGVAATGLGLTFPGGTPSVPIAPVTSFEKIAVSPGTSYPIVVPAGGSITISFYQ